MCACSTTDRVLAVITKRGMPRATNYRSSDRATREAGGLDPARAARTAAAFVEGCVIVTQSPGIRAA
jgi:hypothetical protein